MRSGVIVVMVLFSLAAAPFAMALDGCPGTSTACGPSCSAPCVSVSVKVSDLPFVTVGIQPALPRASATALEALDAPPKSLRSA
jgi:hypothetical protein